MSAPPTTPGLEPATAAAGAPAAAHQQGASPTRALVLGLTLPVLGALAYGLGIAFGIDDQDQGMWGLAILTTVVALAPPILDQARPPEQRHLLLTLVCLSWIVTFALPAFIYYMPAPGPTEPPGMGGVAVTPAEIVGGQWVSLAALVAFITAYALTPVSASPRSWEARRLRDWSLPTCLLVGVLMLLFGWSLRFANLLGLIPAAFGTGFIATLTSSILYGNVVLAVAAIRYRARIAWILIGLAVAFSSGLGFFTGSKREVLVYPAIVVFSQIMLRGRIRVRWILAGVAALALLYPTAQFYREEVLVGNTLGIVDALSNPNRTFALLGDFFGSSRGGAYLAQGVAATAARMDGLGIEAVIVRDTPRISEFQNGRTLFLFFVAFVPRGLWPGKPEVTIGQWITDIYGSGPHITSSTAPSFVGDFYLNFGLAGVLIGFSVLGALLRAFQGGFLGPNATTPSLLVAVLILNRVITRIAGAVAHTFSGLVFALVPIVLVHLLIVSLRRSRGSTMPSTAQSNGSPPT